MSKTQLDAFYGGIQVATNILAECLSKYRAEHPEAEATELVEYTGEIMVGLRRWVATHDAVDAAERMGGLLAGGRPGRAD